MRWGNRLCIIPYTSKSLSDLGHLDSLNADSLCVPLTPGAQSAFLRYSAETVTTAKFNNQVMWLPWNGVGAVNLVIFSSGLSVAEPCVITEGYGSS